MSSLSDVLMPWEVLVYCLNAALAASLACVVAITLSRLTTWSLPVGHALLAAALGTSLAAPHVILLFHLPSMWAIQVSEAAGVSRAADPPPPSVARIPTVGKAAAAGRRAGADAQASMPIPAGAGEERRSSGAAPAGLVSETSGSVSRSGVREQHSYEQGGQQRGGQQRTVTAPAWSRMVGTLLCGLWLAGIVAGSVRATHGLARLRRWTRKVSLAESPALTAAARRAAEGMGLRKEVPVYRSSALPVPASFGLIHPRIVAPAGVESSLSPEQLRAVIRHEMAHIARLDLWTGLLQQAAQVVYWWNPLVRLANRQLADLREQICDDIAIREMANPGDYAATLIDIAERSCCPPLPGTLGIGSSSSQQLEGRIRRIVSPPRHRRLRLSRRGAAGVFASAVLMAATMLLAQVQTSPPGAERTGPKETAPAKRAAQAGDRTKPSLHELIQHMARWEQACLPYDVKAMETFRIGEDLTPQERAKNNRADGRKHQRLMEYAQLAKRVWRKKETDLVDGEVEQGPYEQFSDGERVVQASLQDSLTGDGKKRLEIHVSNKKNQIFTYLHATPLCGVFCLSSYGASDLFSQVFQADEDAVELAWDNGDAKLTFGYGKPNWNMRFVLWLSREHDWHPIRLQRYLDAKDKAFFDEWEATRLVKRRAIWRVAEGTHRYRDQKDLQSPGAKIIYCIDFKVLDEKYGSDVDQKQFRYEIPAGAVVHDDEQAEAEPPPPAKTREITVRVMDIAGQPVPHANVQLPASRTRDWDMVATDDNGVAGSSKAPQGDATVRITASGFRPVTWIVGDVDELRATMAPRSTGVTIDEKGSPVAEAWITNRAPQLRADGFAWVPDRAFAGSREDWSDGAGRFELSTELTLRRLDTAVAFVAVDPGRERMAIKIVPAHELGEQQKLVLRPVCHVHGHCLLEGMTEAVDIMPWLETATGKTIASVTTRRELTADGLRVDFQLRLPPGDYVLKSGASSHHAQFAIPFSIAAHRDDLDLGVRRVPAAGAVALIGKPAPELDVQWRPQEQTSWEELRGKIVVLDFWGTWCRPCVAEMPALMEIAGRYQDQPVEWLSIHTANVASFVELDRQVAQCQQRDWNDRALPFTMAIDRPLQQQEEFSGATSRRYGIAAWPTLIVVDQKGNVVGPVERGRLAETISRLLGEAAGN